MELIKDFINQYGTAILYAVLTALGGYIGIALKNLYSKYVNTKIKKEVVKTCVSAVEQLYKNLHGEEKYNECVKAVSEMLMERGITVSELEIKMLIEAAVGEANKAFIKTDNTEASGGGE